MSRPPRFNSHLKQFLCGSLVVLLCLTALGQSSVQQTSTGFYYPLGRSSWNKTGGTWLGRDAAHDTDGPPPYTKDFYHLGVDMPANDGSSVYAISDGTIWSISTGGWGTGNIALVIKHTLSDGSEFLALYGHVRSNLNIGNAVAAGTKIAEIGPYPEGGDHLHFGVRPTVTFPQVVNIPPIGYGRADNSYWPSTNGFVDPVDWIRTKPPEGSVACSNDSSENYRNKYGVTPLHPNGTLIKEASNATVYVLQGGQKRAVSTLQNLYTNGAFDFSDVITVSSEELALYSRGADVTVTFPWNGRNEPDGRLIKNSVGEISIVTNNGQRRPFAGGYTDLGYDFCKAKAVSDYELYPEGSIAGAMPLVTSGLTLSSSGPYKVGNSISASFTITNVGLDGITFNNLLVGGRLNGEVADFTTAQYIKLNPGQAYNYSGTLQLSRAGNYNFFVAYQDTAGFWTTTVPANPGAKTSESINVAALTPNFAISATPSARTITRGETATYTVTVQSLNSFNSSVSLSALNLPGNQVLAGTGFNPQQVTPPSNGSANSTLTIVTNGATPTGSVTITVRGVSSNLVRETPINLTVNPAPSPTQTPTPTPMPTPTPTP
ncbi:MAG: M23 family metallopeptidase, partial [Acidobacteriota bacterium]|nr:M23 family metallopeptidase [Acidobacteriota bacterium]